MMQYYSLHLIQVLDIINKSSFPDIISSNILNNKLCLKPYPNLCILYKLYKRGTLKTLSIIQMIYGKNHLNLNVKFDGLKMKFCSLGSCLGSLRWGQGEVRFRERE